MKEDNFADTFAGLNYLTMANIGKACALQVQNIRFLITVATLAKMWPNKTKLVFYWNQWILVQKMFVRATSLKIKNDARSILLEIISL